MDPSLKSVYKIFGTIQISPTSTPRPLLQKSTHNLFADFRFDQLQANVKNLITFHKLKFVTLQP